MSAEMALVESIWGNEEEFVTHSRGRVPPYSVDSDGKSGPVRVNVGVMIEKVRIDTVQQTAQIKWWLRQSWKVRTDAAARIAKCARCNLDREPAIDSDEILPLFRIRATRGT